MRPSSPWRPVSGACYLIGTARQAGSPRADLGGGIMAMKITNEVLEAYLNCKTKGHLKLVGETGTKSDYEAMIEAAGRASRETAIARLVARYGEGDICTGTAITDAT